MEQMNSIVIGYVALQSLGLGSLIWKTVTFYFEVKSLKEQVAFLDKRTSNQAIIFESTKEKIDMKLESNSKLYQELRESQIKQQHSLDQIKEQLIRLASLLLDKS